jgi:hypothetical protein
MFKVVAITATIMLTCVGVIAHAMWHEWSRISNNPYETDNDD